MTDRSSPGTRAIPPQFKDVDILAREIVADIFTANGIRMTNDESDPLLEALATELRRRVAAMQDGAKPPTPEEQCAAARRLRAYGCWAYPYHPGPVASEVFADEAHDWHYGYERSFEVRRPYPGKTAAQAVARAAIDRLPPSQPIDEQSSDNSKKPRQAKRQRS